MPKQLTRKTLTHAMRTRLVRHVFIEGKGGMLAFIGVSFTGVVFLVSNSVLAALGMAAISLGSLIGMACQNWADPSVRRTLAEQVIRAQLPPMITDADPLHNQLTEAARLVGEIAAKIVGSEKKQRAGNEFSHILTDANNMLLLAVESADQMQESRRILDLIVHHGNTTAATSIRQSNIGVSNARQKRKGAQILDRNKPP